MQGWAALWTHAGQACWQAAGAAPRSRPDCAAVECSLPALACCSPASTHARTGVIPSLAHAKQHLLRPGAVLAPCRLRVVAAVAASATLHRLLRPPEAACGGAVCTGAALAQLAPRKIDCHAVETDLVLLTEPATVLAVDLSAPELPLAAAASSTLRRLQRPVTLAAWAAAQQAGGSSGSAAEAAVPEEGRLPTLKGASLSLYTVAWFEYEFPGGVVGSTAPAAPPAQRAEHWQQVVHPLAGAAAGAALALLQPGGDGGGSGSSGGVAALQLTAGYRVDRLWFELDGLLAEGSSDGERS